MSPRTPRAAFVLAVAALAFLLAAPAARALPAPREEAAPRAATLAGPQPAVARLCAELIDFLQALWPGPAVETGSRPEKTGTPAEPIGPEPSPEQGSGTLDPWGKPIVPAVPIPPP